MRNSPTRAAGTDRWLSLCTGSGTVWFIWISSTFAVAWLNRILSVELNGHTYYAQPPLGDGSGNPPPGWGNSYDALRPSQTHPWERPASGAAQLRLVIGGEP